MKLGSFYKDNIYIITQSNHGSQQNNRAFDFGYLGYGDKALYAPAELNFKRRWGNGYDGGCEYWVVGVNNCYIQFVHVTPENLGKVPKGNRFAISTGDHAHVTLFDDGWKVYLDYADRSGALYWWKYGAKGEPWTNWGTYGNYELNSIKPTNTMRITGTFKCQLNNATWNVRANTTSQSPVVGQTKPNEAFLSPQIETYGELVNGTTLWVAYGTGWISAAGLVSCLATAGDPECSIKLEAATKEIARLSAENGTLTANMAEVDKAVTLLSTHVRT